MSLSKFIIAMALAAMTLVSASYAGSNDEGQITVSADNLLVINSEISSQTMGPAILKAKELDKALSKKWSEKLGFKKKPIYIFLYSPGGSIQTGLEFIEAVKGLGRPVHTVTLFAASMAFQFAQQFGDRYIVRNGVLMSHRAAGQMEGSFGGPSPSQMESRYGLWYRRIQELDSHTVARTKGKQTLESYQKAYGDELWMTGEESVKQGYADKVVKFSCDDSLDGVTTGSVSFMGLNIEFDLDKCPINTNPMNPRIGLRTNKGMKNVSEFIAQGGSFDPGCQYQPDANSRLCSLVPGLSVSRIEELVQKFKEQFVLDRTKAIPLGF